GQPGADVAVARLRRPGDGDVDARLARAAPGRRLAGGRASLDVHQLVRAGDLGGGVPEPLGDLTLELGRRRLEPVIRVLRRAGGRRRDTLGTGRGGRRGGVLVDRLRRRGRRLGLVFGGVGLVIGRLRVLVRRLRVLLLARGGGRGVVVLRHEVQPRAAAAADEEQGDDRADDPHPHRDAALLRRLPAGLAGTAVGVPLRLAVAGLALRAAVAGLALRAAGALRALPVRVLSRLPG